MLTNDEKKVLNYFNQEGEYKPFKKVCKILKMNEINLFRAAVTLSRMNLLHLDPGYFGATYIAGTVEIHCPVCEKIGLFMTTRVDDKGPKLTCLLCDTVYRVNLQLEKIVFQKEKTA